MFKSVISVVIILVIVFSVSAAAQVAVTTYHNDIGRTGQNLNETILTPSNVNVNTFGKLFSYSLPTDSYVYAQPLYLPNVAIPNQGTHNVLFIATERDVLYAFDADGKQSSALWSVDLAARVGGTTVTATDIAGDYMASQLGISSTPAIDTSTGTIYVLAYTKESSGYVYRLHALDVTNGAEKFGGPVKIQGSVSGTGDGGTTVTFNPATQNGRPSLLLTNGNVYISFASYGDNGVYHGWVFGYSASTLQQIGIFNTTPNGSEGSAWALGALTADASGNVYTVIGNGTTSTPSGGKDFGESTVRLNGSNLSLADYFTPYNYSSLNSSDSDVGSAGLVLLPDQASTPQHLAIGSGKEGRIYLLNRDNLGHFNSSSDQIVQEIPQAFTNCSTGEGCIFGTPAYWNNYVYFVPAALTPRAFQLTNGRLSTTPVSTASTTFNGRGATPSISANGNTNAILWAVRLDDPSYNGTNAILYAYDATNLGNLLYSSDQNASRDGMGVAQNFIVPTIANGKVYVATRSAVTAFGLFDTPPFGFTDKATGAQSGTTTFNPSDTMKVVGWAADQEDGSPVSRVSVLVDGASVGDATLGLTRNDVAQTYNNPAYANSGWTFSYPASSLAVGNHTVTAVAYDSQGTSATLTQSVTVSVTSSSNTPPLGWTDKATGAQSGTSSFTQTDTMTVIGWAADAQDGAPVSRVSVLVDGVAVGNATLGIARTDVAQAYNNSAYTNSGWTFSLPGSSLSVGTHAITSVAYDSTGMSATLSGTRTVTVTSTSNTPPFGWTDKATGAQSGTTSFTQNDTMSVTGWAADQQDGSPVSRVSVLVDGTAVGNATLGQVRNDVAQAYNNPAYANSGWAFSFAGANMSVGTHTITSVAYDSQGLSATLMGSRTVTVSSTSNTSPFGFVDRATGAQSGTSTFTQSDTMNVTGWAADQQDGSPVSRVSILVDGAAAGNATLGDTRNDVAQQYNDPSYANSGWHFSYAAASMSAGTHTITAVAYDSQGATATLINSVTVTVNGAGSTGNASKINHVIFMMQENRSFDNYFGMLNAYRASKGWNVGDDGKTYLVDGLDHSAAQIINYNDEGTGYGPFKLGTSCIDDLTSAWLESYGDVNKFDFSTTRSTNMDGYVHIAEGFAKAQGLGDTSGKRAMGYYDQNILNYYYFMASEFAVSDRWFSPVSSKTVPNRIATMTGGTTQGLTKDPSNDDHLGQLSIPTIFQELDNAGVSWKIYYTDVESSGTPSTSFTYFTYANQYIGDTKHLAPLSQFYTDVQNGTLPAFAYIEPGFNDGTDEHPGVDIVRGQQQVANLINALMNSVSWKDSVFFLSYDEGGPFDHVPPVPGQTNKNTDSSLGITTDISSIAVNPDSYKPCPFVSGSYHCDLHNYGSYQDPGWNSGDAPAQQGFAAQLGFRVPNLVISPFTRRHYVSHVPMDHTAIIKFVENRFINSSAHLTARDAAQPNLLDFFDFTNTPWALPPAPPTPATASCDPSNLNPAP